MKYRLVKHLLFTLVNLLPGISWKQVVDDPLNPSEDSLWNRYFTDLDLSEESKQIWP